jgi:glycosyltransferase involved in cell wall biosynthesis
MIGSARSAIASESGEERSRPRAAAKSVELRRVDLSVVVPVFNEKDNVVPLVDELEAVMRDLGKSYEILVIDDGSRDGTSKLVRAMASERAHVRAIFFRRNCGQSAAVDAGFRAATGAVVVTMDGDLQNDPHDIPRMLALLDDGYDVVSGWRRDRKDALVLRRIPSRIANFIIRRATGTPVHDLGCSLKVYRREVTDELNLYGEMHRFLAVLAHGVGASIGEIDVTHRARRAGVSKYGVRRTIKVMLDLVTVLFMRRYQTKPIYVFGGLGMMMLFVGSCSAAYVLWEKWNEGIWVHRNPLFILAVMFTLVGVQLLVTGLIAELVIRTYYESQGKRAYVVASRAGFDRDDEADEGRER